MFPTFIFAFSLFPTLLPFFQLFKFLLTTNAVAAVFGAGQRALHHLPLRGRPPLSWCHISRSTPGIIIIIIIINIIATFLYAIVLLLLVATYPHQPGNIITAATIIFLVLVSLIYLMYVLEISFKMESLQARERHHDVVPTVTVA